ncbi:MAG: LysR family transcriptional regulator [Myxococcota bacterium]
MDRLESMKVFAEVAQLGSFRGAARSLRISSTAVSRHVSNLEDHLGTQLLVRTTRRLSLTEPGRAYLLRCVALLDDLEELERDVSDASASVRGRLRVTAGVSFAQEHLGTLIPAFVREHPDVEVEFVLSDHHLDLVAERIDLAIRIGQLEDSTMIARRLAPCRHVVCASPGYLEGRALPRAPAELAAHDCIIDTNQPRQWWLRGPEGESTHAVRGRYIVNSAHAARDAALAGIGLAYLPTFVAGPRLRRGELVRVLGGYEARSLQLVAVYAHNRHLRGSVRALVDFLAARFGPEPPWDAGL